MLLCFTYQEHAYITTTNAAGTAYPSEEYKVIHDFLSWCSLSLQYVSSTLRHVEQSRVEILENMEDHVYPVLADLW
jgi:hypothetical protein